LENMNELADEIHEGLEKFSKETPKQAQAFMNFLGATEEKGALDEKQKELISIALSVATHCKWCIAFHVKNALEKGATKEEILEAGWIAVLMGGGPALMYFMLVQKALEDFK